MTQFLDEANFSGVFASNVSKINGFVWYTLQAQGKRKLHEASNAKGIQIVVFL